MDEMREKFYDICEQTKYTITVSLPDKPENVTDLFITTSELQALLGRNYIRNYTAGKPVTYTFDNAVTAKLKELTEKLVASKKKTIPIDDDELLDVLKDSWVSNFLDTTEFGRHGNRICYAKRYKRKKTKPSRSDVRSMWYALTYGFRDKLGCYPSHIPGYDRHCNMFKAFKKIVGWRIVRKYAEDKEQAKFFRQIWDNPEEYIK